jgi:hypothetical protein
MKIREGVKRVNRVNRVNKVNSYREKTTDELYEEYLNNLLSDIYDVDQSIEASCYMASNEEIRERHTKGTLGTLLKEQDPIAFHVGKREWRSHNERNS